MKKNAVLYSVTSDSATSQTAAHQAPLSLEFSRQEYWDGLPFLSVEDLPDPESKRESLAPPALAGRFFTTAPLGKSMKKLHIYVCVCVCVYVCIHTHVCVTINLLYTRN